MGKRGKERSRVSSLHKNVKYFLGRFLTHKAKVFSVRKWKCERRTENGDNERMRARGTQNERAKRRKG